MKEAVSYSPGLIKYFVPRDFTLNVPHSLITRLPVECAWDPHVITKCNMSDCFQIGRHTNWSIWFIYNNSHTDDVIDHLLIFLHRGTVYISCCLCLYNLWDIHKVYVGVIECVNVCLLCCILIESYCSVRHGTLCLWSR